MSQENDVILDGMLGTKTCAKCGKEFFATPMHVYKDRHNHKWYCSWTCFNRRKKKKSNELLGVKQVEQLTLDGKSVKIFRSATNAHESTGFKLENIQKACKEQTPYNGYLWRYVQHNK